MFRGLLFFLLLVGLSAGAAHAERRVALLMGNSAYPGAPLENPRNDVELLQEKLQAAGFDKVEHYLDLNVNQMSRRIEEFQAAVAGADVAVFFYSGHGIEIDGTNFLLPIDAKLEYESDVKHQAIAIDDVVWALRGASKLQLILLDACRDNPFGQTLKHTKGAPTKGLAPPKVNGNVIFAYAAQPGHTAFDRDPANLKNSPFSSALGKYLTAPDMEIRQALGWVRDYVLEATQNDQEPYQGGSIGKDLIYLGPHTETVTAPPTPKPMDTDDAAAADYDRANGVGSAVAWEAFLRKHPSGLYADFAKAELGKSEREKPAPRPNESLDAGLPVRQKPIDPDDAARGGHDQAKDVSPIEHVSGLNAELAKGGPQHLASLENPKPNEPVDAGPVVHPKPPDAPPPQAPEESCALEFEAASVDAAGVGHFAVKDSCGKLNVVLIDYANHTFTQASASPNRAEFTFDFFAGPSSLIIRAADDGPFLQYQARYFDQSGLAKAVIIWQGTTDLDLHAFENSAEPNSAGEVWRGNPRSLNEASAYGGGFMSQLGQTAIPGVHVQVYTYRRSFSIRSVEFRVNQRECAPDKKRVKFDMLRYQNGQFGNPDGPVPQGALPRQCGAYAGNDKESWAPRAKALDLKIPF